MKKILVNLLALGLVGGAVVACSSGSSSSTPANGPAAPSVTPATPPAGFAVPTNSASGAAFNLGSAQIALPTNNSSATSGYTTYSMPAALAAAITTAGISATTVTKSNGNIVVSLQDPANPTQTLTYVLTPPANAPAGAALNATVTTTAESYSYESTIATTNVIAVESSGTSAFPHGLFFATTESIVVEAPNPSTTRFSVPLTSCTGVVTADNASTISATKTQGTVYLSFGTQTGKVCVLSGANATWTNLTTYPGFPTSKYTAGNVNYLGFPYNLNTGSSLVGYWSVGTAGSSVNLYRITGSYVGNTPTGSGFLNTTSSAAQTTSNGTTQVTFTNVPSNSIIYSSFVDSNGNLWVGTTNGQVYVLRTGATAWTNSTLAGATGNVTVAGNGTAQGITASAFVSGAVMSSIVN